MNRHREYLTEKEQEHLYPVHHMHHLKTKKGATHELHHCFLFSEKEMKGEKFTIDHLVFEDKLYHFIDRPHSGKLYDHADRAFPIRQITLGGTKRYLVE